jgi:hypothetical protein
MVGDLKAGLVDEPRGLEDYVALGLGLQDDPRLHWRGGR